ncbi:hypothetical protein JRO89_XS02G0279300 [Xanthoceras sorbifolium]|uniref:Uncharacterized protein n=1 Tax=Xanthoceras sorbifolium TaxID=99658 RepID=A0ABQ8IIM8_9ROSI|nr:hypothetical protein JRO89_XS02G0279300 [Xanthoceras sorbifolium]
MKGVPLRIEIGPKDLAINQALRQKKLILAPCVDYIFRPIIFYAVEEDVKERTKSDKRAAKTLCTPFYQSEMLKGIFLSFSVLITLVIYYNEELNLCSKSTR